MKIPEAEARLFNRMFVCRKCKTKIRADDTKIRAGKILCRNRKCKYNQFRVKTKEKKVAK